ncbi:MAG: MFS transporter [Cytophagaceae bacterium]
MSTNTIVKNDKKLINAWCMYDWANSVYSLTITTAIFPSYYLAVTSKEFYFLGFKVINSALYSFALSAAYLFAAILSPFLTAIADYTGKKKLFMQLFCYIGSASCAYLFFFTKDNVTLPILAFMAATVGYSGSIVFYNAFLPEIATDDYVDKVSARGFAYGYVGSVLLLIFNLVMILFPELFFPVQNKVNELLMNNPGITYDQALEDVKGKYAGLSSRISFLSVGFWWFAFSQYTFWYLPSNVHRKKATGNWLFNGIRELRKVLHELEWQKYLKIFLISFFLYNLGVQTVMLMATIFGKEELNLHTGQLIGVILIIQIIAIFGANIFARISSRVGNIYSLAIILTVWIAICIIAFLIKTDIHFYALAVIVGFVMGGVQSMSRSTYSKLIPDNTTDNASYFSFYDVADKISTFSGTLLFGLVTNVTGSMRMSALVLAAFFIAGLIIILRIPSKVVYNIEVNNEGKIEL